MIYADVEFYKNKFLVGRAEIIPFSEFTYWARFASNEIRLRTNNRIDNPVDDVKMCTCELAEFYYKNAKIVSRIKKSESVGSYSVSYADVSPKEQIIQDILAILFRWLSDVDVNGTPVLFRGN